MPKADQGEGIEALIEGVGLLTAVCLELVLGILRLCPCVNDPKPFPNCIATIVWLLGSANLRSWGISLQGCSLQAVHGGSVCGALRPFCRCLCFNSSIRSQSSLLWAARFSSIEVVWL